MLRFPVVTRYSDYDAKGHVNNAVYFTYFESARVDALRAALSRTMTGRDAADPPLIVAEARIKYVSPAQIGEPLEIEISLAEIRTKGFSFHYRIVEARNDRLVAEGDTVQVAYDYAAGRSMPIPAEIRAGLEAM
jgi:acyl-CoA thioester hydrolase